MSAAVKEAVDNIIIKHFQFQSRIEITGFTSCNQLTIFNKILY